MRFRALIFALCCAVFTPAAASACFPRPLSGEQIKERAQRVIEKTPHIFRFEILDAEMSGEYGVAMRARIAERLKGEAPDIVFLTGPADDRSPCPFASYGRFVESAARPDRPEVLGSDIAFTHLDAEGRGSLVMGFDQGMYLSAILAALDAERAEAEAAPEAP